MAKLSKAFIARDNKHRRQPPVHGEAPVTKIRCKCDVFVHCQISTRKRKLADRKKKERQDTGGRHGTSSEPGTRLGNT